MIIDRIKSRTIQDLLKVLSGNVAAQGLGFLTIVLISRDLGPSQYGIFSLLLAIFTISVQISDFGISTSRAVLPNVTESFIRAVRKECRAETEKESS